MSTELEKIARAISLIARGEEGPAGLEMLSIALAGEGLSNPIGEALNNIASALNNIAEALEAK